MTTDNTQQINVADFKFYAMRALSYISNSAFHLSDAGLASIYQAYTEGADLYAIGVQTKNQNLINAGDLIMRCIPPMASYDMQDTGISEEIRDAATDEAEATIGEHDIVEVFRMVQRYLDESALEAY